MFVGLAQCTELDLSKNIIHTIQIKAWQGLDSLSTLKLDGNKLVSIGPNVFNGLDSLSILKLGENELVSLGNNAFNGLTALKELDLQITSLTTLPWIAFGTEHGSHLKVGLHAVPLVCNASLCWVKQERWLRDDSLDAVVCHDTDIGWDEETSTCAHFGLYDL